jgi:hypothetical protein
MSDQETEHERTLRKSAEVGAQSIREGEDERILKAMEAKASALPRTEGGRIDLDRLITCSNLLPEPGGEVARELAEHCRKLQRMLDAAPRHQDDCDRVQDPSGRAPCNCAEIGRRQRKRIGELSEILNNAKAECDVRLEDERDAALRAVQFLVDTRKKAIEEDDESLLYEEQGDATYLAGVEHARDVIAARKSPNARMIAEMAHGTMIGEFIEAEVQRRLPEQLLGKKVYVLCEDTDMTMRSQPWPNGEAVLTEEEAEKWAAEDEGCDKRFHAVTVRRKL